MIEAGYTVPTLAPGGDFSWRVADRDALYLDDGTTSQVTTRDGTITLEHLPQAMRYRAFMADTLTRLRAGHPPLVGFSDYLGAMRLVDTIYQEAHQ
jgi:predicted dehydrogenase